MYDNRIDNIEIELRKERIKNDSLVILATGQARRLVADTLTQRELRSKINELGLEIRGLERSITQIGLRPKDTVKEVDTVLINEGEILITDYYPSMEDFFIKYNNTIDIETQKGNSTWTFSDLEIDLAISQNDDGTFEANMRAPDFITINSLDVQATPMTPIKRDNFGILLGGGIGQDFRDDSNYIKLGAGVRFKKTYLMLEANSNKQADVGIKYEF